MSGAQLQTEHNGHLIFVIDCWGSHLAILSCNVVAAHDSVVTIVLQKDGKRLKLDWGSSKETRKSVKLPADI